MCFKTYFNKILLGSAQGRLQLWNIKKCSLVYTFQAFNAKVLILEPAPAIDVVAIRLADGRVILLNLKFDEIVMELKQDWGAATAISFRTDDFVVFSRKNHTDYGSNGSQILSAGEDSSLRAIGTISETLNKNLGHASYNRKASKARNKMEEDPFQMPSIVEFTAESTREKKWDNIAAIHSGLVVATTWSFNKCKMGELRLVPDKYQNRNRTDFNVEATCISLTHCENFVIIGYSAGDVERFNIQSGIHRQTYGGKKLAHKSAVRGVHSDCLNQMVISGDGNVPLSKLKLLSGITMFRAHPENELICIVLDNFSVNVLDSVYV